MLFRASSNRHHRAFYRYCLLEAAVAVGFGRLNRSLRDSAITAVEQEVEAVELAQMQQVGPEA